MARDLCFLLAKDLSGPVASTVRGISEEEWLWHIVQHMRGVRHKQDYSPATHTRLWDPVGYAVRKIALNDNYQPLTESETCMYQELLVDALHGNLESVKAKFGLVKALRDPYLNPVQPVAAMGALKGHLPIVEFALDRGATKDREFCLAVQQGANTNPEMQAYYEKDKVWYLMGIELPTDRSPKGNGVTMEQIRRIDREIIR